MKGVAHMEKPLTEKQIDSMRSLNNYVGKTVLVMTSQYRANVSPDFKPVGGVFNAAVLRSLAARGYIRIDASFWKGAKITVLRPMRDA
jgi:hypothetical protein